MSPQDAASHAHRPVPTYVATAFWLVAAISLGGALVLGWDTRDAALVALLFAVVVMIGIDRLYTTALQDRIILLEMKVRCAEVLPAGEDAKLDQLSAKQVVALRFASDAELGRLLDRAIREHLSPNDIKVSISTWRPDIHRT